MSQNMIHYHLIGPSQHNAQIGFVCTCTNS
ncbi:hypothetical protein F383_24629 [Gossypium arboreum]|uniref:Uncharacterized protein n=1 Tax=Gossypium arboreum TaxID=29729 RepID=A0A0B0P275_GOSAR|nr:hypothetical protein F383_24629 [Gossypium arboreum]